MGCDIHIVLESRDPNRDTWVGVRLYDLQEAVLFCQLDLGHKPREYISYRLKERDYEFFAELANVRGDAVHRVESAEERGLPGDASSLALLKFTDADLHSRSWINMRELLPLIAVCKMGLADASVTVAAITAKLLNEDIDLTPLTDWVDADITLEDIDDWRLVFAFDN